MVIPCKFPEADYEQKSPITPGGHPQDQIGADDVLCTVGPDGDTWTIPVGRALLKKVPMLEHLTSDGQTDSIRLANVDKRGFEQFVSFLASSTFNFTSVPRARTALDVACHFQYACFLEYCVHYLDQRLSVDNVLCVYHNLYKHCNNAHTHEPSAPAYNTVPLTATQGRIQQICSYLMHNCLLVMDAGAKEILAQELIEELSYRELLALVSRDTLQLNNETVVFEAVMRWARCQCMKLHVPLGHGALRQMLEDLAFCVRYALMSKKEFLQGPAIAKVLSQNEIDQILAVLEKPKTVPTGRLADIGKPRCKPLAQPLFLSLRTKCEESPKKNCKPKLEKKEKFLLTCLSVFVAIFD